MGKRGAPALPPEQRRDNGTTLKVRLLDAERADLERLAQGRSLAATVRDLIRAAVGPQ